MEIVTPRRLNPFHAVVQYRSFRLLWTANILMQMSEWVQTITLGWVALTLTNSTAFVGRVNFMSGVPLLLLAVPAGALLDRVDRRRTLVACQLLGALVALSVAFFIGRGSLAPWHLLVVAVLNGSLLAVSLPATQALVPSLVEGEDLTNALGLHAAGSSSTRILGPSLAGVIISALGIVWCFVVQGAGLLLATLLSVWVQPYAAPSPQRQAAARPTHPHGLWSVVRQDPVLLGLLLQAAAPGLLAYPVLAFVPVIARDQLGLGPSGLGALLTASGIGAVLGSLLVATLGSYWHKGWLLAGSGVLYGCLLTAFVQSPWVVVSGALFACSSCLAVVHNGLTTALLQARAPEELRGHLTGALALSFGLTPIGPLVIGEVAERIGVANTMSGSALICSIGIALTMVCYRTLVQL